MAKIRFGIVERAAQAIDERVDPIGLNDQRRTGWCCRNRRCP